MLRISKYANRLRLDAKDKGHPYCDEDGSCPFLEWLDRQPVKVQAKCLLRVERLRELGHELRRPEADLLRDGVYELRASLQGVHYRVLYFFHGTVAAILSHGIAKERTIPSKEIERAIERKKRFESEPARHSLSEEGTE